MLAQRGDEARVALLDLLAGQPMAPFHQVDQTQVARAEHHDLTISDAPLRRSRALRRSRGRLGDRMANRTLVLVAGLDSAHAPGREAAGDQVVEPVAVALAERRALRLTVVGEDDDVVRPGRVAACPLDHAEALIELAQRLERVLALEPGVMRDLVVAGEGRVYGRGAARHVLEDGMDDEVADEHAHPGSDQGIAAPTLPARPD